MPKNLSKSKSKRKSKSARNVKDPKKKRRAKVVSRPMTNELVINAMQTQKKGKADKTHVDNRRYIFQILQWFADNDFKDCLQEVDANFKVACLETRGSSEPKTKNRFFPDKYLWFDFVKIDRFAIPMSNFIESLREVVTTEDDIEEDLEKLRPAKLATLKKYRSALYHYRESAVLQADGRTQLDIDASRIRSYESAMKGFMSGKAKESEQLKLSGKMQSNVKRKFTQQFYSGAGKKYSENSNTPGHFFFHTLVQSCGRGAEIGFMNETHFFVEDDSIVITFYDTKGDLEHKFPINIHFYANPFQWHDCFFFSFGAYVLCRQGPFKNGRIFDGKTPTSTHREQLTNLFPPQELEKVFGLKSNEVGLHSARKFILSKLSNASENPPSDRAISLRAGHSLATIDKAYYSHEARGDMRIGRLMIADEGTREIMCYPPHWKNPNDKMLWEYIDECVPWLSECSAGFKAAAAMAIASIVYHADILMQDPCRHPELLRTVLFQSNMIHDLKNSLTGIWVSERDPPLIRTGINNTDIRLMAIQKGIEDLPAKVHANGVNTELDALKTSIHDLKTLIQNNQDFVGSNVGVDACPANSFQWGDGTERSIPENFTLSARNVMSGWCLWHGGNRHFKYIDGDKEKKVRIIPYKYLTRQDLRKQRRLQIRYSKWKFVMLYLENKLKIVMPNWDKEGANSSKVRRKLSQLIPSNATKYEGNHPWNQSVARVYDVIKNIEM